MLAPDPRFTATKPTAPATKPTAPKQTGGPFSQLLAPVDTKAIMDAAHTQALANTQAIVQGVHANQTAIEQQAENAAQNEQQASQAAAHFLQGLNLGGKLQDAYRQAGNDQAGLAAGYSGELQRTVGDQAAQVNKQLSALGAPGGAPTTAPAAGNAVYALGGQIPANQLLAQAPGAVAQAEGAVKGLLGYGQQSAIGTLGAGQQNAARLNPQITAALAKEPALAQSLYASLSKTAETGRQNNIRNYISQEGVDARNAATKASADARAASLAESSSYHDRSLHIQAVKANNDAAYKTAQLAATKAYRAGQLSLGDYKAETARLKEQRKQSAPDATLSGKLGVIVNPAGQPIPGADGKPQILPGFKPGPDGRLVKIGGSGGTHLSTAASGKYGYQIDTSGNPILNGGQKIPYPKTVSASTRGPSASQVGSLQSNLHSWRTGQTGSASGAPVKDPAAALGYHEALQKAIQRGPATQAWTRKATSLTNLEYFGYSDPKQIALSSVRADKQNGLGLTDSITAYLKHYGNGEVPVTPDVAAAALARVYGQPIEAVKAAMTQVSQLAASGQIGG